MTKDECEKMANFLRDVPGMNVLPCDDPFKAMKGYVAFHQLEGTKQDSECTENGFVFEWQFAKAPEEIVELEKEDIDTLLDILVSDFVSADDPKDRKFGFIRYADLDSDEETEAYTLPLTTVKQMPAKARYLIQKWRSCRLQHEMPPVKDEVTRVYFPDSLTRDFPDTTFSVINVGEESPHQIPVFERKGDVFVHLEGHPKAITSKRVLIPPSELNEDTPIHFYIDSCIESYSDQNMGANHCTVVEFSDTGEIGICVTGHAIELDGEDNEDDHD